MLHILAEGAENLIMNTILASKINKDFKIIG